MSKLILLNNDIIKGEIEKETESIFEIRIDEKEVVKINKKFVKEVLK